jgi:hypothetical protein
MENRIRIRATDDLGNVAYVYGRGDSWLCALASGTPAAFSYAGLGQDEMAVKFALEDAGDDTSEILIVCERFGNRRTAYEIV